MAIIANTVTSILQYISDLRGESSTNTDASRIRAVSRAGNDFSRRRLWSFCLQPNKTTTGDGSTQDFTIGTTLLPCREKGLDEVFVGGTTEDKRYAICDYNEFKKRFNNNNADQIVYMWYDATADLWKMHISPTPANLTTITYTYFFQQPDVTATTDVVYAPDATVIAKLALGDIYHGEDELQKEQQQKSEAEQLIDELTGIENQPSKNQLYGMKAIESQITNRGIGGY